MKIFKNAGFSLIYGRSKREVFEYGDVINHMLLALRMLCEGCCHISIVLASERAKSIEYATCGRVFKNVRVLVDGVKLNNHVGKSLRRAIIQRLSPLALLNF